MPGSEDQDFHSDSKSGERAIVYLTDVDNDANGPIEFKDGGKILGPAGTYVHYSANAIHRGCKSNIDRYALALAFDSEETIISTVGAGLPGCTDFNCPVFYKRKNPAPDGSTTEECCELDFVMVAILIIAIAVLIFYFTKIYKVR
jgi:hypothetical protein